MAPKRQPSTAPHRRDPFDGDFSNKRRTHAVSSDGGRKRGARANSNLGHEVPSAYFRHEVEEFDPTHAKYESRFRRTSQDGAGSSTSSAGTSTALEALPPAEEYDAVAFDSAAAAEDFVPEDALDAITAQVMLRSVREAEEKAVQAACEEEIDQILLRQGPEADAVATEKSAYWKTYAEEISDFGLATYSGNHSRDDINHLGTVGYVAPEYLLDCQLTEKSDVYSFGVVLLELLLGRKPGERVGESHSQSIVSWAMPHITDRTKLPQIIDPVIQNTMDLRHLYQVAAVAVLCVQPEPSYIPLIADVLHSLVPLVPVELGETLR